MKMEKESGRREGEEKEEEVEEALIMKTGSRGQRKGR